MTFKTKLIRRAASPQQWKPLVTPRGAVDVPYTSGDMKLRAFVSRPAGAAEKFPAVLFLHGGFAYGDEPGDSDWEMPQPYRDAGYVVMVPVLRGENGQGGTFSFYYDEVDDVIAAANELANLPYVDPGHIYVSGHSAGATLAVLAAMTSNRFKAAASFSACLDQKLFVAQQPHLYVFDQTDPREFQMRSPVAFATSLKCPTRLYFGTQEAWCAPATNRTVELARQKGIDVAAERVAGNHFSSVPAAMRKSIEFFRQN